MRRSRILASIVLVLLSPQLLFGWSEGGHHLIGYMAFKLMKPENQDKLLELIKQHPLYDKDFKPPKNVVEASDVPIWLAGRACYWPDVALSNKDYHRATWHYQLGTMKVIGDPSKFDIPKTPPEVALFASLESQQLYIEQALHLCKEKAKPDVKSSERAIALCWIGHLVGDAHQPLHAGALYCEQFPKKDGDRGGNLIETVQSKNLHAVWDQLLGPRFDHTDAKRRMVEIEQDHKLTTELLNALGRSSPAGNNFHYTSTWLKEGRDAADVVYTQEVVDWVQGDRKQPLELSEAYLKQAGRLAQVRALLAAHRLANAWSESL